MKWKNICVYANVFVCSSHPDIRAIIYIFYMDVYIYFRYDNCYMTCILMRMHVCLSTHVRIHGLCGHACVRRMQILLFNFLQPMSTTIYVYPSAWNTRMEMCHTCRWECDSCSKAWALRRFIYCFNDAVCFIFMYFVRKDEIKTVNWANFSTNIYSGWLNAEHFYPQGCSTSDNKYITSITWEIWQLMIGTRQELKQWWFGKYGQMVFGKKY